MEEKEGKSQRREITGDGSTRLEGGRRKKIRGSGLQTGAALVLFDFNEWGLPFGLKNQATGSGSGSQK